MANNTITVILDSSIIIADLKKASDAIELLRNQRNELLAALEYHQEQTRPIQRSIDAIARAKGIQLQTSAPAIIFFPAGSLGEEVAP